MEGGMRRENESKLLKVPVRISQERELLHSGPCGRFSSPPSHALDLDSGNLVAASG